MRVTDRAVEKRASGYQFQPGRRIVDHLRGDAKGGLERERRGGRCHYTGIRRTKQRVNLGPYGNESKKNRYAEGPLPYIYVS